MYTEGQVKRDNENWHYDKYKDPHEFPDLDLSTEEESSSNNSISVNISKKLPKISDEKFKKILEIRKNSNNNNSNNNNNINNELLSASTPKLKNTVDLKEDEVFSSRKNMSPLLLNQETDTNHVDNNLNMDNSKSNNNNNIDALLKLLKEQTIQINNLETDLNKKNIQLVNYESKIELLENENSKLNKKLNLFNEEISLTQSNSIKLETLNLKNNEFINKLENDLKKEKSLNKKEIDMHKKVLNTYNLKFENLVDENNNLLSSFNDLKSKYDSLKHKNEILESNDLTLKTELSTKLDILNNELNSIKQENYKLNIENQALISKNNELIKYNEESNKKIIGNPLLKINKDTFKDKQKYQLLEMNIVDELSLIDLQNFLKNILSSFNVKYSDLKKFILFIRDDIFTFFNEIHSILHCKKVNNSIIIDNSNNLDIYDQTKMKACMELLLNDIKKLKGII